MGEVVKVQQVVRTERKLGRLELLNWLNESLRTDYAKVQDCADGIAYCQLVDSLSPGIVPLHKLSFTTRTLDDNIKNLRILEEAMFKLGIRKDLDVAGVAKGKFQENNEFLQWLHALLQKNAFVPPDKYKAFERRWAAQERQKKGLGGVGSRSKGRAHQLNNNLVPNEYEWHEGATREAPPQIKPPDSKPARRAPPGPDVTRRRSGTAAEGAAAVKGPVVEALGLWTAEERQGNRVSGGESMSGGEQNSHPRGETVAPRDGKYFSGNRGPARGSDSWVGMDVLESLDAGVNFEPPLAQLADPPFAEGNRSDREEGLSFEKQQDLNSGQDLRGGGSVPVEEGAAKKVSGGGVRESGQQGGVQTSRQQAELESLIAYLESELVTRLQAFADLKKEVKLVDEERQFYYEKLRRVEQLCGHAHSIDAVTQTVLDVVEILSKEEDCPVGQAPGKSPY